MTVTAEETLSGAGYNWDEVLSDPETATETVPGPLKGTRGTRTPRASTGTRRRSTKRLDSLQKRLSSEMFQAGALIGVGLHTTGYYICQESDAFTRAIMDLAVTRPEWVDALETLANIQPGLVIGRTFIGIGASVAVDRGRADPEKQFMKFLGVYTAWKAVNDAATNVAEGSGYRPPPSTFVPVA